MFLPFKELEKRFKTFRGSYYYINEPRQTIDFFAGKLQKTRKERLIKTLVVILILALAVIDFMFFAFSIELIVFIIWLIIIFYHNVIKKEQYFHREIKHVSIHLKNQTFTFHWKILYFFSKKLTVPFSKIENLYLQREEEYINEDSDDTKFKGNSIYLEVNTKTWNRRHRKYNFNVLTLRNSEDALAMLNWFNELLGKNPLPQPENPISPSFSNISKTFTFVKKIPSSDVQPEGFPELLTDIRYFEIFENRKLRLKISMDAGTSRGYVETENEKIIIERKNTNRKEYYIVSFPAFDYEVATFPQKTEVGKLRISNIRKSWKCYDATASALGISEEFRWKSSLPKTGSKLTTEEFRKDGGLYCDGKSISIFSRVLNNHFEQSNMRNQNELEGYFDLDDIPFNPVLVAIAFYIYEMELTMVKFSNDF